MKDTSFFASASSRTKALLAALFHIHRRGATALLPPPAHRNTPWQTVLLLPNSYLFITRFPLVHILHVLCAAHNTASGSPSSETHATWHLVPGAQFFCLPFSWTYLIRGSFWTLPILWEIYAMPKAFNKLYTAGDYLLSTVQEAILKVCLHPSKPTKDWVILTL